jgi:peptidyl-prolyl cis-trans isomerase C
MTQFSKAQLFPAAAALLLFATAWPACAQDKSADALFPDPVVATGQGIEIKRSAVQDAFITEKTLVAQQQNVTIPESERPRVESDILLRMVVNKILVLKATAEERSRIGDEVAKYLDEIRKAAPSDALFQEQVKASGKTLEQIKAAYLEKRLSREVLIRELAPSNAVSVEAVKKFYEDEKNASTFAIPEKVRVAQVLIAVIDPATQQLLPPDRKREKEKLARDIKAKAEKGDDFEALARQYSDEANAKQSGGVHTFARHSMAPAMEGFEAAAFSLKTNQISDLVESPYGYHILKLLEKLPPSKVALEKVSAEIKDYLANEEINKRLPAYVPKLEAEYNVKFLDPNFSPSPLLPLATNDLPALAPGVEKK